MTNPGKVRLVRIFLLQILITTLVVQGQDVDRAIRSALAHPDDDALVSAAIHELSSNPLTPVPSSAGDLFDAVPGKFQRQMLAAALLKRTQELRYFQELAKYVQPVLDLDPPPVTSYDSLGKPRRDRLSPEFEKWCENQHAEIGQCELFVRQAAGDMAILGMSGDIRAVPLLRRALRLREPGSVIAGAQGLSLLGDKESVPVIVAQLERFPEHAGVLITWLSRLNQDIVPQLLERFFRDPKVRQKYEDAIKQHLSQSQ